MLTNLQILNKFNHYAIMILVILNERKKQKNEIHHALTLSWWQDTAL